MRRSLRLGTATAIALSLAQTAPVMTLALGEEQSQRSDFAPQAELLYGAPAVEEPALNDLYGPPPVDEDDDGDGQVPIALLVTLGIVAVGGGVGAGIALSKLADGNATPDREPHAGESR